MSDNYTYDSALKRLGDNRPAIAAFKSHSRARMSDADLKKVRETSNAQVLDALLPNRGFHLARELEYIYATEMETVRESLNAVRLFPIDSQVPPGATHYTMRRSEVANEWRYFHGEAPSETGNASAERFEETYPILPMVSAFKLSIFDDMSSSFAGTNIQAMFQKALRRGFEEFINDRSWVGTELPGILNHKLLPKAVSAVSMANATPADDIIAEIHRLINIASERSKQTFGQRLDMLIDDRIYNRLSTRKRSATTEQTILQAILQDNPFLGTIEPIHELRNKSMTGGPAMLLYPSGDAESIAHVIPRGLTMLPMQSNGFEMVFPAYAMHGGIIMRKPLNNLLVALTL